MERQRFGFIAIIISLVLTGVVSVDAVRLWGQDESSDELGNDSTAVLSFGLELEGEEVEDFIECTGLGSRNVIETAVVATEEGLRVRKTPGALEWSTIVLRDRKPSGSTIWEWRRAMETGDLEQAIRDGAIRVYDGETGELKARWEFKAGWAARLMVTGRGEELVIVHDGFIRDQPYSPGLR